MLFAQEWEEKASLPASLNGRHHPVMFTDNEVAYYLTGANSTVESSDDFYRYDPVTDTWTQLDDFPGVARGFSIGVQTPTKGYIGFGLAQSGPLNDLWEFDFETETWTELSPCPCDPRFHPAFLASEDGKLYMGLGGGNGNKNDWWQYDIATDTWEEKATFPSFVRHHPYQFNIGEYQYVGMGHGAGIYNDLYRYDSTTDTWEQMADLPAEGRVAGAQFDYNGKGYVLSGDGDDHWFMDEGEFWEYDPEMDSWTQLPSHPGRSRWAPAALVMQGIVYFSSGYDYDNDIYINDLLAYQLEEVMSNVNETIDESLLSIFPNPTAGELTIELDLSIGHLEEILVFDVLGQLLDRLSPNNNTIHLNLPTGQYQLEFKTSEGVVNKKVQILK